MIDRPLVVTVHSAKDGGDPIAACCIECQEMGDGRELLDWVETILVYKLPRLSREESQTMLGFCAVELKQTRFYQEVFAGGRAEGLVWGETRVLTCQLTRRFGPLSAWVEAKLARLEAWAERVLAAVTLEAVFAEVMRWAHSLGLRLSKKQILRWTGWF